MKTNWKTVFRAQQWYWPDIWTAFKCYMWAMQGQFSRTFPFWLHIGHLRQSHLLLQLQERRAAEEFSLLEKVLAWRFFFVFFFQVDVRLHWSLRVLHQADPKGAIPMNMTHSQCQIEPAQRNCYALWVGSSRYEIAWTAPYTLWLTICVLDWSFWSK